MRQYAITRTEYIAPRFSVKHLVGVSWAFCYDARQNYVSFAEKLSR